MKARSDKRAAEMPERSAIYDWLHTHQGPYCAWPGCREHWVDPHEVLTRGRGGSHIDRDVIIGLCRDHNHEATDTRPAQCLGVVVPSWVVAGFPGRVPVAMEVARKLRVQSVRDEAPPCPWRDPLRGCASPNPAQHARCEAATPAP